MPTPKTNPALLKRSTPRPAPRTAHTTHNDPEQPDQRELRSLYFLAAALPTGQHALAVFDAGVVGLVTELGEKAFQVGGEFEVDLLVGELSVALSTCSV